MVRFKESGRVTVTKLDFLAIPKNGKCRMFKTFSAKNMKDIMTYRKEHLKGAKGGAEIEKEPKRKNNWCNFNDNNSCHKRVRVKDIRRCGE